MRRKMLSRVFVYLGLAAMFGAPSTSAIAAPVAYDENIDGDLSRTTPWATFAFDAGTNNISGTISYYVSGEWDRDNFAFIVPVGYQLTQILFAYEVEYSDSSGAETTHELKGADPMGLNLATFSLDMSAGTGTLFPLAGYLPLGPGTYGFRTSGGGISYFGGDPYWITDYQWSFIVEPVPSVPEPSASLLLVGGLGTLALGRRKLRRRS